MENITPYIRNIRENFPLINAVRIKIMNNKTVTNEIDFIQKTIGIVSEFLPPSSEINLNDHDINLFLNNITESEKTILFESIAAFIYYISAISPSQERSDVSGWTNFVLIILFGLVERIMQEEKYVDCYNYLQTNIEKCIDKSSAKRVLEDWRKTYGSSEKIRIFFDKYLTSEERQIIIEFLKMDPKFTTKIQDENYIGKYINWIIACRNGFVHKLDFDKIPPFDFLINTETVYNDNFKSEKPKYTGYPTIGIKDWIRIILTGVLRKFDKENVLKGILNLNFLSKRIQSVKSLIEKR